MSLKDKYQPVFDLMNELNSSDTKIWADRGTLFVRARVPNSHSKELIMQKVQQVNLEKVTALILNFLYHKISSG